MSTNKTKTLNLHSWEPNDPFVRTEFNDNFSLIDANAEQTWAALERKADVSAVTAARAVADNAQSIANGKVSMSYGHYTGDGQPWQYITLGFQPKVIIVWWNGNKQGQSGNEIFGGIAFQGEEQIPIIIKSTGFVVYSSNSNYTNLKGNTYAYLALY